MVAGRGILRNYGRNNNSPGTACNDANSCLCKLAKADTPQQVLKTWAGPQSLHARIDVKIDEPVGVLFVGFLQIFNRAVVFSQADVDAGEEVRCNILLLC